MRYTSKELRNPNMHLLKRVQRQMDKAQSYSAPIVDDDFSEPMKVLFKTKIDKKVDYFEEPFSFEEPKKTRLGLYKKRGGR